MHYFTDRSAEVKEEYILDNKELESLFHENNADVDKIRQITGKVNSGAVRPRNLIETLAAYTLDEYVDGFVIQYPHGTVISQGERSNYFRGENEDYPTSKTTLYRELDQCKTDEQKEVVRLVAAMRIDVFRTFLQRIKYVRQWEDAYGRPFYEAIAQHYGFMTEYLDITSDFNVAMFFACCVWENDKKKWRPMTEKECKDISVGVLYHAPVDMARFALDKDQRSPIVVPIGYQPFYRCQKQVGYVRHMEENEDFKSDALFERLKFEHSVTLSEGVFEYMHEGKDIYPDESLMFFENEIDAMKTTTTFSTELFDRVITELGLCKERNRLLELVRQADFSVNKHDYKNIVVDDGAISVRIPRQKINRFNLKNERRSPETDNEIELSTRWTYIPSGNYDITQGQ